MRTALFLLPLLLFSSHVFSQGNGTCETAKEITVADSACNLTSATIVTGVASDSISPSFLDNIKILPKKTVWFTFITTSKNTGIQIGPRMNYSILVFTGSCPNNLTKVQAFSYYSMSGLGFIGGGINFNPVIPIENQPIGTKIYVQISTGVTNSLSGSNTLCAFRLPDTGQKVISKSGANSWLSKTSWVPSRIPTALDTAVISDGSKISFIYPGTSIIPITIKSLIVGQGGASVAKLYSPTPRGLIHILGNMIVHPGDSILGNASSPYGDRFLIMGDIQMNGTFAYQSNVVLNPATKPILHFNGTTKQIVSGNGQFANGSAIPHITVNNPIGLDWNVSGKCRGTITPLRGVFNNSSVNLEFENDTNIIGFNSAPGFGYGIGSLAKMVKGTSFKFPGFKRNAAYFLSIYDDSIFGKKDFSFVSNQIQALRFYQLYLDKFGTKVLFDSSCSFNSISYSSQNGNNFGNGILAGQPQDTLSFQTCSFGNRVSRIRHSTFGYHRNLWQQSGNAVNWDVPAWSGGKGRSHTLTKYNLNDPTGQWLLSHVINQPPSGTLLAPGTILLGPHVLEINSNTALGDSTRLQMEVYHSDSLFGLKENWRIAQSPSPTGPWTPLETRLQNWSSDSLVTATLSTRLPIKLSNGHYFAFVTVGLATDLTLTRILPISTHRFGCLDNGQDSIRLQFRNNGLQPVSTVRIGAVLEGQTFQTLYTAGFNWDAPLQPGATDTLSFKIPSTFAGLMPLKCFVATTGDNNPASDTLAINLQTLPASLPFRQTFDTCVYSSTFFSQAANPLRYGYPIVSGWDNRATGPYFNQNPTGWNTFRALKTANSNPNKYYLNSVFGYIRDGIGRFVTQNIGPVGTKTWLSYKLNVCDFPTPNDFVSTDTFRIEISSDCGKNYTLLRQIDQSNFTEYFAPAGTMDAFNEQDPPVSIWWDSIPFPPGESFHIRFRIATNGSFHNNNGSVRIDDIRVKDTLFTANRPQISKSGQNIWVYPNPGNQNLSFAGIRSASRFQLMNASGWVVEEQTVEPQKEIQLPVLPAGLYFWKLQNADGTFRGKWVKE